MSLPFNKESDIDDVEREMSDFYILTANNYYSMKIVNKSLTLSHSCTKRLFQ